MNVSSTSSLIVYCTLLLLHCLTYVLEILPYDPRMLKQENIKSFFNNILLCRIEDSDVKVSVDSYIYVGSNTPYDWVHLFTNGIAVVPCRHVKHVHRRYCCLQSM